MPKHIIPIITDAGTRAVFSKSNQGFDANIAYIALGDGGGEGYLPDKEVLSLRNERLRVPVNGGERTGSTTITVQSYFSDSPEFWVREVGFILEDGTFLAIWSDETTPLLFKSADGEVILAFSLDLRDLPENSINVTVSGPDVNILIDRELNLIITNQAKMMCLQFHHNEAFNAENGYYPGVKS